MNNRVRPLSKFFRENDGPTMAEYGLLLALVALLAFASVVVLGTGISTLFENTGGAIKGAVIPKIP